MRISDWSSDVCSSDLIGGDGGAVMRVAVDMFQIVQLGKLVRSAMIDGDVVSAFAKARDDRYARRRRSSNHQSRCHCRTFSKRDGGHPARHGIAWTVGRRPALVNNYVDERIASWFEIGRANG